MNLMGRLVVDLFSDIARLVMGLIHCDGMFTVKMGLFLFESIF